MKILYCNKYNFAFSGTEAYIFSAIEMMRSRGHETALFSMADPRGTPTPFDRHFVRHKSFKASAGLATRGKLALEAIYSSEARRKIRRLIREFRPDIAHVRNIYHHLSPSILWELKAQGIPVVYHVNDFKLLCPSYNMVARSGEACERCKGGKFHEIISQGCYSGGPAAAGVLAFEAYVHRWLRTYARCVDLVLAPSQFVKQKFIEDGWEAKRIQVLPHFQVVPDGVQAHPGGGGTILYFGRLSREKGIADLLATIARFPHLQLVIAGDGPLRPELQTFAETSGLGNVRFAGHVSGHSLEKLIDDSQFTVFPSHAYETFGKSILESYAHGRPVIASDLGSRRELVHEGETGVLYSTGNVDQLSAAIKFLSEKPDLASRMGKSGRRLVLEKYSPDDHFRALDLLYEKLKGSKSLVKATLRPAVPPRVAFIGGRGVVGRYSGIESFYEEAGTRLSARGHRVTAYCRSYFTPGMENTHRGLRIVRLPTIRSKHLDTLVHTLLSTVHACCSDYDLVHFHTLGPSLFSCVPRLFGKKTVVTVQGLDWQRKKWSWFARQVLKTGEWASARLPNKTIVVSHTLENYYNSRYSKQVAYVPNGTEVRQVRQGISLAKYGLQPGHYVLFLGRFSPEKNCDMLVEAFEQIDTNMKLVLAGGSSHTDEYMNNLRRHESDRIIFLDWLSGNALQEVLTNATLFVLPSDLEGLSLALLDAMGAGICVLASDVPENREVICDAGFTFRCGDAQDLKQMLAKLLCNDELRHAAGRKARDRIQQEYLWDGVAEQLEQVYLEVCPEVERPRLAPASVGTGNKAA
jgi:glycosyltransferase involved in cell wall biosynthesis